MNIDWNKIKEKYPKGYNKFINFYKKYFDYKKGDSLNTLWIKNKLNNICYCDLEKFFMSCNILLFWRLKLVLQDKFQSDIIENYEKYQTKAIYNAFEILEERLNDKENICSKNI